MTIDILSAPSHVLFESILHARSQVTVGITLYNYRDYIIDALDSVWSQRLSDIDLIVVDDRSTDDGAQRVLEWLRARRERFGRALFLQHTTNQGLAAARNLAFSLAATPFVFVLDADNELYPRCLEVCVDTALRNRADAVYTVLEVFGESTGLMSTDLWDPSVFQRGNYIDAMALVATEAWRSVGGYRRMPANGWEDYDFWLKFCEAGRQAIRVPEILCRYRLRKASMLRTVTNASTANERLKEDMRLHHPIVEL